MSISERNRGFEVSPMLFSESLGRLALQGDAAAVLEVASLARTTDGMRFWPSQTFRDGFVSLGDDASDTSGRVIYPNNGTVVVMPYGHDEGFALVVDSSGGGEEGNFLQKRNAANLTTLRVRDLWGAQPQVMEREMTIFKPGMDIELRVRNYGFVKVLRGTQETFPSSALQIAIEREGLLTEADRREFSLAARLLATAAMV